MIFALYHTKGQMSTPFLRSKSRPWIFAHVFNVPLSSLQRLFISAGKCGIPQAPNTPYNTKTQISCQRKQKTKRAFVEGSAGAHLYTVAKFQGLHLSNGVGIVLWRSLFFLTRTSLCFYPSLPSVWMAISSLDASCRCMAHKWVGVDIHNCSGEITANVSGWAGPIDIWYCIMTSLTTAVLGSNVGWLMALVLAEHDTPSSGNSK